MDILAYQDILSEICKYLSYIQLLFLSRYFPKYGFKYYKPELINILKNKLENLGINSRKFVDILIKYKSYISGPILFSCLTGLDIRDDIFTGQTSGYQIINLYSPRKYLPGRVCVSCQPSKYGNKINKYFCSFYYRAKIFQPNNYKIIFGKYLEINQILFDKSPNIIKNIFGIPDFDFCKILYNGQKLYINNILSLILKKSNNNQNNYFRIKLYQNYNFIISENLSL